MNCRQANRLLPLWIGHDLADTSEAEALRLHLSACPDCSLQQRRLQFSLDALQAISTTSLAAGSGGERLSLWPRLAMMLKEVPRRRDQFNGWIPASAMALAALLMVAVSVVQIRREMGDSIQATWNLDPSSSAGRNLFETDQRFAPGSGEDQSIRVPVVVQPVNHPNF